VLTNLTTSWSPNFKVRGTFKHAALTNFGKETEEKVKKIAVTTVGGNKRTTSGQSKLKTERELQSSLQ
jgi:hypothetical protein